MEYKDYRVEDLLNDTNFILWAKYKENDDFWTEFITHHPHKAEIVEKASKIINRLAESESIQNIRLNQDQTWYQITNRLFRDTDKPSIVINRRKSVTFFSTISAAVIIIFCVWYYVQKPKSKNSYLELTKIAGSANSLTEKINNSDKAMKIILQDSSFVVLTPGSKLSFPFNFDVNKREVFLSGKGFFSVSEDVDRPFFVNTGEVITRVLGTSFWIDNSLENQDIEVIVKTGKVTVYERKNENATASKISNGLILNANHKATFMSSNRIFKTSIVDRPVVLPMEGESQKFIFEYNDVPLKEVLDQLESAYGINIELDRNTLKTCSLTANLSKKELFSQLEIICAAIQGSYEIIGSTILITGKGCD